VLRAAKTASFDDSASIGIRRSGAFSVTVSGHLRRPQTVG